MSIFSIVMDKLISPVIRPEQLLPLLHAENVVLIDARTGPHARDIYNANHLAGAQFIDLDRDMAEIGPDAAEGGRHPLPTPARFAELLGRIGINSESHVVVYDAKSGANAAARFWWMLKSLGHKKVQVLDGGFDAAVAAGIPASNEVVEAVAGAPYVAEQWLLPLADLMEVEARAGQPGYVVVDVREQQRYDGVQEPIDLVAGHIPGAINIPYTSNLDENGFFRSREALLALYSPIVNNVETENTIVHCGSGVTACHTLLALDIAGLPIPKLYTGSWSEWSRNGKPIATGKNL